MNEKIIWLAAYPKAGSTWVRIIIHELLGLHGALGDELPSLGKFFPRNAPTYPLMSESAKLLRTHFRPTHAKFQTVHNSQALETIGVITVRRHPLDVLLSHVNYAYIRERRAAFIDHRPKKAEQIVAEGNFDQYIDRFVLAGGCPERLPRCGRYADFYEEWEEFGLPVPHLALRYEEMVENPAHTVAEIAAFLALPVRNAGSVAAKVEQRTQLDGDFFWRKRAYNFREMLSEATIARFESAFAGPLRRLGY